MTDRYSYIHQNLMAITNYGMVISTGTLAEVLHVIKALKAL